MQRERLLAILIQQGWLTRPQADHLENRQSHDPHAFWEIVSEMLDLKYSEVWQSCASQLIHECPRVNLVKETFDPSCLRLISARDAWEHLVLPLRSEDGQLVCATTEETLADALAFLEQHEFGPYRLVISEIRLLEQFIAERYAYEGVEIRE